MEGRREGRREEGGKEGEQTGEGIEGRREGGREGRRGFLYCSLLPRPMKPTALAPPPLVRAT